MRKSRWIALTLVVTMLMAAFGMVAIAEETIKIGGIGVLTGDAAEYGEAVQKGVDLYIEKLNAAGGIDGKSVVVIWEDDRGEPADGILAFNRLVENEGVVAIIGAVITPVTLAVAEESTATGIPVITASSTAYDITTDRPNVFRTCFLDPFQGKITARFAHEDGIKKVGVIYDNGNDYSKGLFEAFVAECDLLGIEVIKPESASGSDVDFRSQLTNIKNENPEAIFVPHYGKAAALILSQANEMGLKTKFFGGDGISNIVDSITDTTLLTNIAYTDLFTTEADSEMAVAFVNDYNAKYNEPPSISFSATGYDAALVLCEAIRAAGTTDFEAVVSAIRATSLDGVTGKITFDDHNDPIKSAFFMTFDEDGNKVFIRQQDP